MKIDAQRLRALIKSRGFTNTSLAAKAGITRQALQTMLRQEHVVEIRERTVKGLAHALQLPSESFLSPDPLAGYKKAVADENAALPFSGPGLPTSDPKSMDEVFVPIKVIPVSKGGHKDECSPSPDDSEDELVEELNKLEVEQCLTLRRVLIRGEPGIGKTTALRHAARKRALAADEGGGVERGLLPLMVPLADFANARERDSEMTLIRFVVTRTLPDASSDYWDQVEQDIERELMRGSCLVLLDGLDEVNPDRGLFSVLSSFISQFAQNHFGVTSRVVGLDLEAWRKLGFTVFEVTRWGEEEIGELIRRWYGARPVTGKKEKKQLEQRARELTAQLMGHQPLAGIASNPLMVTILAALHYSNAALPRRKVDLYAKIVEMMLETWDANKQGARPGDPLHGIDLEGREFGWLLGRLALQMQREGQTLRPRWWVNDRVQQFLLGEMALEGNGLKEQSERVIRYLCERTGLLVERGDGVFGFGHRTFQEYFAARGLLVEAEGGEDIVGMLRPYLFHFQWQEVVIYVAASLSAPRATTLLRVILDDPDPAGRFLRRGQRLALRCLVEGATIADRALLQQVFSGGEAIGRSRWLGISIGFISFLSQLAVTRHEVAARQMLQEIEETAKKELPGRDYLVLYFSAHDGPHPPRESIPGRPCRTRVGGRQVRLLWPAVKKKIEDPGAWYKEALERVRSSKIDISCRKVLVSLLGEDADRNDKARQALKRLLTNDPLPEIRAECAIALEEAASTRSEVSKLLMNRLCKDDSDIVRARCAGALRGVTPYQADIQARLEQLFSSGAETVRAGAVKGLSGMDLIAPDQQGLLSRILTTIKSPAEPSLVRRACIWAAASFLGHDEVAVVAEKCLDDKDETVKRAALHVLADAVTDGGMEWSLSLVEKIETMLMAVKDPCPHLFADLVAIVAMKEAK